MSKSLFEAASAVIFDPVVANRNASRTSLHQLGFGNVDTTPNIETLTRYLENYAPDLLLVEVTGVEEEVCKLVRALRQGEVGRNPFLVVIVTTWRRDGAIIGKVIDSGADDLVARPISTRMLGERIKLQIERRKGFVVTQNYIGPDRRRDTNRPGSAECLDVPNTLRVRATDRLTAAEADRRIMAAIEEGKTALAAGKLKRDVVQLCYQWRSLERQAAGTREFFDNVERVGNVASSVREHISGADSGGAEELCAEIAQAVETIASFCTSQGQVDFVPHLRKLGHAALRLGQIYAPLEASKEMPDIHPSPPQGSQVEAA